MRTRSATRDGYRGKPAVAVRGRLAARNGGVRDVPVGRVLLDARTVALRDLVGREADLVVLACADGDHEARPASGADEHVLRVRRAMHQVPRTQLPHFALHNQGRFPRDDEEVLLVGLPVVHAHRLARPEHERIDAELGGVPAPAFEVVGDDADGAAAVGVTPLGVAHVEDVPASALRREPVLGLLELRLGNDSTGPPR